MAGKKVFIYGQSAAWGEGTTRVSSQTPIQKDSQDKIRWQNESLWPAYASGHTPPSTDVSAIDFVQPEEILQANGALRWWPEASPGSAATVYAHKKIHEIRPRTDSKDVHMAVFNENTDFGERNELYDLYIDLDELIKEYSTAYGLTRNDFPLLEERPVAPDGREAQGDNFGPQAILKPKFAKFLQDIYGIVCLPYVDTETSRPSRLIPGEGYTTEISEQFDTGFFRRYEDHTTTIDGLLDADPLLVADNVEFPPDTPYARIDKRYNSMLPDYENALHENIAPNDLTRLIPNIYLLEEMRTTTPDDVEGLRSLYNRRHEPALLGALRRMKDVEDFVRLSGLIRSDSLLRDYFCAWTGAVNEIVPFDAGVEDRFRQHADAVKALLSRQPPDPLQGSPIFSHLFIAPEERAFYSEAAGARPTYPFYNKVSLKPLSGIQLIPDGQVEIYNPATLAGNKLRRLGLTKYFARFITTMIQSDFDYCSIVTNPLFDAPSSFNLDNLRPELRSIDILRLILSYNYIFPGAVGGRPDYENYLYIPRNEIANQRYRSLIVLGRGTDGHLAEEEFDIAPSREGNELIDSPSRNLLTAWLRTKIKQKLRTYQQILEGDQAQSEIVLYRIEKRLNGEFVQDFLVPNTDDLGSIFEYYDTQVIPGTPGEYVYTYKIYATYLVVGNEYRRNIWAKDPQSGRSLDRWNFPLRPPRARGSGIHDRSQDLKPPVDRQDFGDFFNFFKRWYSSMPEHAMVNLAPNLNDARSFVDAAHGSINLLDVEMDYGSSVPGLAGKDLIRIGLLVNNRPSVRMIETLVYQSTREIFSNPPLPPNVEFYPLKDINNKMLINMSMFVNTDLVEIPIPFNEGEEELFGRVRDSQIQQRILTGEQIAFGKILFSNDDFPSSYEVYRLQKAPTSYADFTGALHYSKDMEDEDGVSVATSHLFADSLVPNVKYYYTFRSRDVHDLVSNPSAVYQLELVDNLGAVYLLVETYNFPEKKENYSKDLQQYLKISPSLIQSELNQEMSGLVGRDGSPAPSAFEKDVVLGPDRQQVWNKKLKFRITSKKTGRKIDINVDFKTKVDTTRDVNDLGCPPVDPGPPAPQPPEEFVRGQGGEWIPEGPGPPEVRQEADRDLSDLGPRVDVRRIQISDEMAVSDLVEGPSPLEQEQALRGRQLRRAAEDPPGTGLDPEEL